VKDIAAGCVLVAAAIAVLIGALTFGPHLLNG
jgi:diacylglycerol kinase